MSQSLITMKSSIHSAVTFVLSALLCACAQAQPEYTELSSPEPRRGEGFGDNFGGLPDMTGDGIGEFYVVGWFGLYVFDGQSLTPLYKIDSPCNSTGFPTHTAGDVNGDGVPDLLLGDWTCVSGNAGSVDIADGTTGQYLTTLYSPDPVNKGFFGYTLRLLPDMTGDGKADWLIHQPENQSRAGRVYIFDSQTHEPVRTIENADPPYRFHMQEVDVIPDVDGDGQPELLVGAAPVTVQHNGRTISGSARMVVRSLQTGKALYELADPAPGSGGGPYSLHLAGIGDVSGDGVVDIGVGQGWKDNFAGAILIFSGADGRWLRTIRSSKPRPSSTDGGRFGALFEVLPDLNNDGVPELWTQEGGGAHPWFTYLFDGATSALLRTIQSPTREINPYGGPRFYIGTVRRQSPEPGLHALLFGLGHLADSAGRVYFMPFTPLPKRPRLKPVGTGKTGFRIEVHGESGRTVEVQGSADFKTWEAVATVSSAAGETELTIDQAHRFFRALNRD